MGNQVNDDFYHSLSRKELQILCKKHGLRANKSKSQLAKLLASYYQKKNVSSAPSEERSSGPTEVLPRTSPVSDLKIESQLNPMGGTNNGVHKTRVETANVDNHVPSCFKEVGYDKRHVETVKHNELRSHLEAQNFHVLSSSTANVVLRDNSNSGTVEGFGCSNYDSSRSQFGSQHDDGGLEFKRKEPAKSDKARDSAQNLPVTNRNSEPGNIPRIQCRDLNFGTFPADTSFIFSNGTCLEVLPTSFQFYVRSEEGINLYVDLSSSPSDWIKSLKNEVCISPEVQNNKSWALHRELKILGDSDGQMKASLFGNTEVGFQPEGDPNCFKSSLDATVKESGYLGLHHSDDNDKLLRSSAIIPTSASVEMSGHEEESNRMVSSVCKPNSDIQNPTDLRTLSSPRNGETVPLGLEVPNTSQIISTGNSVLDSKSDGPKCLNSSEHQPKNCIVHENTETGSVGTSSLSHERDLSLSSEIHREAIPPSTGSHENGSGACLGCSRSGSMEIQLSEIVSHCEDASNFLRQTGERDLEDLMQDLQTENGRSANCELDQNTCKDSLSACPEERGGSNLMNETESSECSQIDNLLEKTCKRSRNSETEGLQSKRQRIHSEDHNNHPKPAMRSLRSAKSLASEVFPRRSMRLASK